MTIGPPIAAPAPMTVPMPTRCCCRRTGAAPSAGPSGFADQGSEIIPYGWFLHLEQADSGERFADPDHLSIASAICRSSRPPGIRTACDRLHAQRRGGRHRQRNDLERLARHELRRLSYRPIDYGGRKYLIDGAPAMADFQADVRRHGRGDAGDARRSGEIRSLRRGGDRRNRHYAADGGTTDRDELRAQLELVTERRDAWNRRNQGSSPYGHARLDAVGSIFNEVAASGLDVSENAHPANAPVSYPFIWDTPQHDRVEWNGARGQCRHRGSVEECRRGARRVRDTGRSIPPRKARAGIETPSTWPASRPWRSI